MRVYKYFFDFIEGQQKWLNEMAARGWRLQKCGQLSYDFEECAPGAYEYAVEFVADKSYAKSRDYKAFLEEMGYRTFYKNINVGVAFGKASWRPYGEGAGQVVTAPGGYFKELIIVEKRRDGRPFELHTDLGDALKRHKKARAALLWGAGGALMLAMMFAVLAAAFSPWFAAGALVCAVPGALWLAPAARISKRIRALSEEAGVREHEKASALKTALVALAAVVLLAASAFGVYRLVGGGFTVSSGSAIMLFENSGDGYWNARYSKLNGYRQRSVALGAGAYEFNVEIEGDAGELTLTVTGADGREIYICSRSARFTVELAERERLRLRVDAQSHSGSYKISWGAATTAPQIGPIHLTFDTMTELAEYSRENGGLHEFCAYPLRMAEGLALMRVSAIPGVYTALDYSIDSGLYEKFLQSEGAYALDIVTYATYFYDRPQDTLMDSFVKRNGYEPFGDEADGIYLYTERYPPTGEAMRYYFAYAADRCLVMVNFPAVAEASELLQYVETALVNCFDGQVARAIDAGK